MKTCAHPTCTCAVSGANQYCSDACRDMAQSATSSAKCNCGHPDCKAEKKV